MIKIELTKEEAEELEDALMCYRDEGPEYAGWKSKELEALYNNVVSQLRKQGV